MNTKAIAGAFGAVILAVVVWAVFTASPPTVEVETVHATPPLDTAELNQLAELCHEQSRVHRFASDVDAKLQDSDALSVGLVADWQNVREAKRELARRLVEVYFASREARRAAEPCVWWHNGGMEGSVVYYDDAIGLLDEIVNLLGDAGRVPTEESLGFSQDEFRTIVRNDIHLQLMEAREPEAIRWIANRACRRGFDSVELGLDPSEYTGCRGRS